MLDRLIIEFDKGLKTLFTAAPPSHTRPDAQLDEASLSASEKKQVIALMRVNHCGEICAQALYQGQALSARNPQLQETLKQAAHEESEHLAWTQARLIELGGRTSVLNPLWYSGSLALGMLAGVMGERWNLGFLQETEYQVEQHLSEHLQKLPPADHKSRALVERMRQDEKNHAQMASDHGATTLPLGIKIAMKYLAKVMTTVSYYG